MRVGFCTALLYDRLWGSEFGNGRVVARRRLSGLAWAAHHELLERHGLYDACILGAGDRAYSCAAFGRQRVAQQGGLRNARQREHYMRWADPFAEEVSGRIALVEGELFHLWHGSVTDRRYRERHTGFERFAFDPFDDIAWTQPVYGAGEATNASCIVLSPDTSRSVEKTAEEMPVP